MLRVACAAKCFNEEETRYHLFVFVSIYFMMTKRFQTIALAVLLLDGEERIEDKVYKTLKIPCWIRSWLQSWEEKGCSNSPFKKLLVI